MFREAAPGGVARLDRDGTPRACLLDQVVSQMIMLARTIPAR